VAYHPGADVIRLRAPPDDARFYHLRDECEYAEIQIEATVSSYFQGFG